MIEIVDKLFILKTKNTMYAFKVLNSGLLSHIHYGEIIDLETLNGLEKRNEAGHGGTLVLPNTNDAPDHLDLEYSSMGIGDFREVPLMMRTNLGYTACFKYQGYALENDASPLPNSHGEFETLRIDLFDEVLNIELSLYYRVFTGSDVISRYTKIKNKGEEIHLERCLSLMLDLKNDIKRSIVTFDGNWSTERNYSEKDLESGIYINDSKSGASSSKHNPFVIVKGRGTNEYAGEAIGINLVYSGNHITIAEVTPLKQTRILMGINPYGFDYMLKKDEEFITPEAVMTYTNKGLNKMSENFHSFINENIIPINFKNVVRPIVINNWEATYFNFNEQKIVKLAHEAKKLGIELLVLDDGWFKGRDNDHSGLGDYDINLKKLPKGLSHLIKRVNKEGLKFGLWFEPEAISPNSDLYKKHPEYVVKVPNRKPVIGRNELLLDLTNQEVVDYIENEISKILSENNIAYVKWDYNRNISDMYGNKLLNQGEFYHRYIMGLYNLMDNLTKKFPNILFEGCASGGNRFDLGILSFMPQIWTSDNTDAIERLYIQTGTSYGYPLSTISNHVSAIPNHQTLRKTTLNSRFNTALFGVFGFELDLCNLKRSEKKNLKKMIEIYKKYRECLQFGNFYRHDENIFNSEKGYHYAVSQNKNKSVALLYQKSLRPEKGEDVLKIDGLEENNLYQFYNIPEHCEIKKFGSLINIISPIRIKQDGIIHNIINKFYKLDGDNEQYILTGRTIKNAGIRVNPKFQGSGFGKNVRVQLDNESRAYYIDKL